MQADVAWVWRGWSPVRDPYELPSSFRFNHAIVRVKSNNQVYWLDGTNVASYAQGVPGDIMDRPALVLSASNSGIERLPASSPEQFSYSFLQNLDFSKTDGVRVAGSFKSNGADAASWINSNLNTSQDTLNYKLIRAAARTDSFHDWKTEGFKIKSRIVGELNGKFSYTENAKGYRSTAGYAYPLLLPDNVERLLFSADDRESDIVIGEPFTYERDMVFSNLTIVGEESLSCAVDSPWVSVKREVNRVPSGLRIHDRLQLKKQILTHAEYSTPEFLKLQDKLVTCFKYSSVIYKPANATQKTPLN
jgi:hypothetical protein